MVGVGRVRRKLASCRRRWIDGRGGCSPSLPMEPSLSSDGQLATKPDDDDEAGVDCLSALPNDVLIRILLHLEDAAAIGQTRVLTTRWRRLWTLLPELRFLSSSEPRTIASALAAHEATLTHLDVAAAAAAPRVRGGLAPCHRAPPLRQPRLHQPSAGDERQ